MARANGAARFLLVAAVCTSHALDQQPETTEGALGEPLASPAKLTVLASDNLDDPTQWTVDGEPWGADEGDPKAWSHVNSTSPGNMNSTGPGNMAWYARDRSFVEGGEIGSEPSPSRLSSPYYQVPSLPCVSNQEWRDDMGHGCDTASTPMDAQWCANSGDEQQSGVDGQSVLSSGNEACCQCGGGTRDQDYKIYFSFWIKNTVQWPTCQLFADFPNFPPDNFYMVGYELQPGDYYWHQALVSTTNTTGPTEFAHAWTCANPDIPSAHAVCGDACGGGYGPNLAEFLDTAPLPNTTKVTFKTRWNIEDHEKNKKDGYDQINLQVSTDGGDTFSVLAADKIKCGNDLNAMTACPYNFTTGLGMAQHQAWNGNNCNNTVSCAGWGGGQTDWIHMQVELGAEAEEVVLRFAFYSDAAMDTTCLLFGSKRGCDSTLFGWHVVEIEYEFPNGTRTSPTYDQLTPTSASLTKVFHDRARQPTVQAIEPFFGWVRPGSDGWEEYKPGMAFNTNRRMDITQAAGRNISFSFVAYEQICFNSTDPANGETGLWIDDIKIYSTSAKQELAWYVKPDRVLKALLSIVGAVLLAVVVSFTYGATSTAPAPAPAPPSLLGHVEALVAQITGLASSQLSFGGSNRRDGTSVLHIQVDNSLRAYQVVQALDSSSGTTMTAMLVTQLQAANYPGSMPSLVTTVVQQVTAADSTDGSSSDHTLLIATAVVAVVLLLTAVIGSVGLVYMYKRNNGKARPTVGVTMNPMHLKELSAPKQDHLHISPRSP